MIKTENLPPVDLVYDQKIAGGRSCWLRSGNKNLSVTVSSSGFALCCVENLEGTERVQGATTALYLKAKEIMQDESAAIGRDVLYTFTSYSGGMLYWAAHQGRELFSWDSETSINESVDGSELLVCRARIRAR